MKKSIEISKLDKEMNILLGKLGKKNEALFTEKICALPGRFERATLHFYPGAFGGPRHGVVHGRLKRSLKGFLERREKYKVHVGERSDVAYAAVHEYGFRGPVNIKAHTRRGKKGPRSIKAHVRNMHIREKRFFRTPIHDVTESFYRELVKEIGF